jgi:hypothetical protein
MRKKLNSMFKMVIVSVLILVLSGCSFALDRSLTKKISDEKLITSVSKIVDEQLDIVSPYFDENSKGIDITQITGEQVVLSALDEENGKDYLRFNYSIAIDNDDNLDELASLAKDLIPKEEAYRIDDKLFETRDFIQKDLSRISKSVPPSQQIAFQKDLRKLVTRSFVLFAAGIVYMFMPKTMFWGKVSAASAISVATGVLSCTVMSLYQYYKYGGESQQAFSQWVSEISTEPQVSYALAYSMIAVGLTMKRSPIVTGIMICVFSLYQVIDMVKPMLKKYNFAI